MIRFEVNKQIRGINLTLILKKLSKIVFKEFKKSGVISIAVVSSNAIKKINKKYRKKNKSTDILTFVFGKDGDCLGEIILSAADIEKRAGKSKQSITETAIYLIIHGICHIFGFTHRGEDDTKKMEMKEKRVMKQLWRL